MQREREGGKKREKVNRKETDRDKIYKEGQEKEIMISLYTCLFQADPRFRWTCSPLPDRPGPPPSYPGLSRWTSRTRGISHSSAWQIEIVVFIILF